MGLLDYVSAPSQRVAYLFPEFDSTGQNRAVVNAGRTNGGIGVGLAALNDVFVFQFWPQQVTDNYTPNYATKNIPGASHPLYQWVSGNGRSISFTAQFITEIREDALSLQGVGGVGNDFRSRLNTAGKIGRVEDAVGAGLLPSTRYKVNVAAALASLQQYLYPTYDDVKGITKPPKKLVLVLPGTRLGRSDSADGILCIMKAANVTMESWFPSGELRSASVALEFAEIVQYTQGEGTNIRYIGAEAYTDLARSYQIKVASAADLAF